MTEKLFDVTTCASGAWSARGTERFHQPNGSQFGGYVSGLMMQAVLQEPERRGAPVAMTGVFMNRVQVGPMKITTRKLRSGKTLEFWQSHVHQDDALCAEATITFAERPRSGPSFGWVAMPEAPAPETLVRDTYSPPAPPHLNTFDTRTIRGRPPTETKDGISVCWAKEGNAPADYPLLSMFADSFAPRAFCGIGKPVLSSTVSFSTYFHATKSEVAEVGVDYILQEGRGRKGSHGICDLSAALWRRDGLLLATTEQLCWFR